MSIAHLLEDFTAQSNGDTLHMLSDEALEEQRLAAFEDGYGAGWEDAVQAQEDGRGQAAAALTRSLGDLSFTHHEAMTRMTRSLEPMFESLTRVVLPAAVDRGFAARLTEQLCDMAREQIGQPMQLLVPAGQAQSVEMLIPAELSPKPQIKEDPSLLDGQARIQVGIARREVDCSALVASIAQAFDAYVFETKEVISNE